MKDFEDKTIHLWTPKRKNKIKELKKITHLGIGAHADDLEIIALDGIVKHFKNKKNNFFGIVVSDNKGKPRHPRYKDYSALKMQEIRKKEQIKAACLGEYAGLAFLNYPSPKIKKVKSKGEIEDKIKKLIESLMPSVIYTHSLTDRHPTHVAVALRVIGALRRLTIDKKEVKVYGVEVWGSLDWLLGKDKVVFDVSGYDELSASLLKAFKSQTYGNHRYDLGTLSRMKANAVYYKSHAFSGSTSLVYAMNLTPLINNKKLKIKKFLKYQLVSFEKDIFLRFRG